ncbi:MAG: glycosyltransferase family 2 protein [Candidatus Dojkabacteria bacterium]
MVKMIGSKGQKKEHKRPLISIITPVYNGEKFIQKTLDSISRQTYKNIEHIIVDGASTDKTIGICQEYERQAVHKVVIISEPDNGQSDGINKGFKKATGDILTWLNSDDTYFDKFSLEKVVQSYSTNQESDVILGKALTRIIDQEGKQIHEFTHSPQEEISMERLIRWWNQDAIPPQPAIFWKKEVADNVGLLDLELHYVMDYDLWLRMADSGFRFKVIDEYLAINTIHPESKTGKDLKKFRIEAKKVARKYWGKFYELKYWRRYFQYLYMKYTKSRSTLLHNEVPDFWGGGEKR